MFRWLRTLFCAHCFHVVPDPTCQHTEKKSVWACCKCGATYTLPLEEKVNI